jgi:hypothetical protein
MWKPGLDAGTEPYYPCVMSVDDPGTSLPLADLDLGSRHGNLKAMASEGAKVIGDRIEPVAPSMPWRMMSDVSVGHVAR